jgi:hypothetical protein
MLALVLLAGLIPAGALSASHSCKMDCCAGKPPHEAGACHAFLTKTIETEPAPQAAAADEHASQHQEMQMPGAATESAAATMTLTTTTPSDHCRTAQPASAHHASAPSTATKSAEQRLIVRAAQSFTTPCSEECAAAAGMLVPVPRPRETAALSSAYSRPCPPTLAPGLRNHFDLKPSSTERRRRIRPRAPPASLVNP